MQLKALLAQTAKTRALQHHPNEEGEIMMAEPLRSPAAKRPVHRVAPSSLNNKNKRKESPTSSDDTAADAVGSGKKAKATVTATNFLGLGAKKAKAALTARKMARAGLERTKKQNRVANTGSGVPLAQVMRLKYTKGFTQAVRIPCRLDDLA